MIRDILGWPLYDEPKLGLIRQIAGEKAVPASAPGQEGWQAQGTRQGSGKNTCTGACESREAQGKASVLRTEGSDHTRRSQLWAELKRLAPESAAKLRYTQVSTGQLEPMVEETKKAQ